MLSISRNVHMYVCLSVCLCVCSLLRYRLTKVVSHLNIFVWKWSKIAAADFALQNMVETTFPDGLETSGQRAYR